MMMEIIRLDAYSSSMDTFKLLDQQMEKLKDELFLQKAIDNEKYTNLNFEKIQPISKPNNKIIAILVNIQSS